MKYNKNSERDCILRIMDTGDVYNQLQLISSLHRNLKGYHSFFQQARELSLHHLDCLDGLNTRVKDKAWEIEQEVRIAIRFGLDALNKMKATKSLEKMSREFHFEDSQVRITSEQQKKIEKVLSDSAPGIDLSFLSELHNLVDKHKISVKLSNESKSVVSGHFEDYTGKTREFEMDLGSRAGSLGKVDVNDLLKSGKLNIVTSIFEPEKCHALADLKTQVPEGQLRWSYFEKLLASLIIGRDTVYRHARQVEELGLAAYTGQWTIFIEATLLALLIIAIVAAVTSTALTITCIVQNASNRDVCIAALALGILAGIFAGIAAWGKYTEDHPVPGTQGATTSYPLTISIG
jgi:hypothetical protein